jgi:hypothetical protein
MLDRKKAPSIGKFRKNISKYFLTEKNYFEMGN